jgi:type IV secretory pathway VirB10-like protein
MLTNRAALGALALVGVVAAGSGAYIAGRQHPVADNQAVVTHDVNLPAAPGAVTETENSLVPEPAQNQPAPVAAAPARPVNSPSAASARQPASRPAAQRPPSSRPSYSPAPQNSSSASANVPGNPPMNAAIEPLDSTTVERRPSAPEVIQKQYQDLVIPADSVVGLQIDSAISSDLAKVEDPVKARVSRDVKVRDQVAIPAGSRAEGTVTLVDKGGRLKDQARLGIRFHTIVLADGTRLPINTETIYRDGESPARDSVAKIGGGAVGGAVLGAILGGKKGAIIGSTVGAGAGGAAVAASDASNATLPAGATVTVRMSAPATVTVEK